MCRQIYVVISIYIHVVIEVCIYLDNTRQVYSTPTARHDIHCGEGC